jgi:hypothetical protein
MQGIIRTIGASLAACGATFLYSADILPNADGPAQTNLHDVGAQLAGLDSNDYATRRTAIAGIEAALRTPRGRASTADQLQKTRWEALSFDSQTKLSALGLMGGNAYVTALHTPRLDSVDGASTNAIDIASLLKQLASDRYLARASAMQRIAAAVHDSANIRDVYRTLKNAAADATNTVDTRVAVSALLDVARYTWLTSRAENEDRPPSEQQMAQWVNALIAAEGRDGGAINNSERRKTSITRAAAEWELVDALTYDSCASAVRRAIEKARRQDLDDDAAARLGRLEAWTRPGLVVEYWQRRHISAIQYFLVGVPSAAPGSARQTRFDKVTSDVAVCGSGNAFSPGEYPLGVAFPHPRQQAAFFHFVSLPTARERLLYQYEVKFESEQERLRAITTRTLAPALAASRALDDAQLWLLGQLDQPTVARLLNEYFAEVPDKPFDLSELAPMLTDVSSVHRTACLMLALDGSYEVLPALVECAKGKRALGLSTDEPQAIPWIAALAIATRQPWQGVDSWLADLVPLSDRICFGQEQQGDIGATAAAMLLARNGQQPESFGLIAREPLRRGLLDRFESPINADYRRRMFEDRMFKQLGVTPYHFATSSGRADVTAWWHASHRALASEAISASGPGEQAVFTARFAQP